MNLKYQILWFEDDEDLVNDEFKPEIENFLNEIGFDLECTHRVEGSQFDELINKTKYDLILTDLNLEENDMGKIILDRLRDERILTDVLLYSANDEAINRIIEESDKLVERVSFAVGIDNLLEKIKKLIKLTIKKVEDVTNMRGLVIASSIDLEIMMEAIIKEFFKLVGDNVIVKKKKNILLELCDNKKKKDKESLEKINTLDNTNIELLIEENILTTSNIYDALMGYLSMVDKDYGTKLNGLKDKDQRTSIERKKQEIRMLKQKFQTFQIDIINVRNTLAHVKEEIDQNGTPYLQNIKANGTKIIFNNDKYIEIRTNFRNHKTTLEEIKKIM
jgi:CheY-like chemotaxis protein